jgi:replication-associated recombination protein RarA
MASGRYILRTRGGYLLSEVVSALQKSIRRGLLDEAAYWAVEMDLSGYSEYLWRRLRIITSEDIGPANPSLPATIGALYQWWQAAKSKPTGGAELFIMQAVLLLCRSEKTRVVDHLTAVAYLGHDDELRDVPEYALDKHTERGREMGRGLDHFFEEAAKVAPEAEDPDKAWLEREERELLRRGRKVPPRALPIREVARSAQLPLDGGER